MNEIEFLPAWYRSSRRREFGYRTQYVALVGIFIVMVVWSFAKSSTVSRAQARLATSSAAYANAKQSSEQALALTRELAAAVKQAKEIERVDSHIDVPAVLGEISFLVDNNVVLRSIQLVAERFEEPEPTAKPQGPIRIARMMNEGKSEVPLGDVRFKVIIGGLATSSADVGKLIMNLEDSPYFSQVVPSFSRNTLLGTSSKTGESRQAKVKDLVISDDAISASEFEVHCYLANYRTE